MSRHEREPGRGQLAVNYVEIGAANGAGMHLQQKLPRTRARNRHLGQAEWLARLLQQHRDHAIGNPGAHPCLLLPRQNSRATFTHSALPCIFPLTSEPTIGLLPCSEASVSSYNRTLLAVVPAFVVAVSACGGGDELQSNEDHTPVEHQVLIDDLPVSHPYTFVAGRAAHVRIKFFNAAGEDLDSEEAGHFARLTFTPITLATAERREDHHFQFDVTGGSPGTGTVQIGYGHDDIADEVILGPDPVTVTASGGGNPQ
jgi:hypothetical protein